jgi:hypothetical protein
VLLILLYVLGSIVLRDNKNNSPVLRGTRDNKQNQDNSYLDTITVVQQ